MLTQTQRVLILKVAGAGLLLVSLLPVISHRLFYFPIVQSYLELTIVAFILYYGYKKSKQIWNW